MYLGNENEKAKEKKKRNRIVSESNTDLTLIRSRYVDLGNRVGLFRFQPGQG